jgi:hypothetical protein
MLEQLRGRIAAYLAAHEVCIISTQGTTGASAVLARYHLAPGTVGTDALQVDCLLPRWADVTYHLEQDPELLLIIPDAQGDTLRWLQARGTARPVPAADWAERLSDVRLEERYVAMRVTPQRIDLVDESQGWGVCETLDI